MFTKRNVAKFVKDQIVWTAATAATSAAIHTVVDEPTQNQETGIEIGSLAVGYMVMLKVSDRTDQIVDSVADWRNNRKAAKTVAETVA